MRLPLRIWINSFTLYCYLIFEAHQSLCCDVAARLLKWRDTNYLDSVPSGWGGHICTVTETHCVLSTLLSLLLQGCGSLNLVNTFFRALLSSWYPLCTIAICRSNLQQVTWQELFKLLSATISQSNSATKVLVKNLVLSKTTWCRVRLQRRFHNSTLMRSLVPTWARSRYGHHFAISSCEYNWTSVIYRLILSCDHSMMCIDLCLFSCWNRTSSSRLDCFVASFSQGSLRLL